MTTPQKSAHDNALTAVFDLDGTFAHTAPDLVAALNHALHKQKISPVCLDQIGELVGQGAVAMIQKALLIGQVEASPELQEILLADFLEHYETNMPGKTTCFEGSLGLVENLRTLGWKTAICTNKSQKLATRLINKLGLSNKFDAICGSDFFEFKKPDGRHIQQTVLEAGGVPTRSIMFGDSSSDILGAKDANIPSIGVTFGYTHIPIEKLKPTLTISHFNEVNAKMLEELIARSKS